MLLPFGSYKGYGLSVMMELIPGILSGFSPVSSAEFRSGNPTLMLALDIAGFTDLARFERETREFLARVKAAETAPGFAEVLLPGEKEQRSCAERNAAGIPLPCGVWEDLCTLAAGVRRRHPDCVDDSGRRQAELVVFEAATGEKEHDTLVRLHSARGQQRAQGDHRGRASGAMNIPSRRPNSRHGCADVLIFNRKGLTAAIPHGAAG